MTSKIKLCLGAAWSNYDGFTNIDLRQTPTIHIIGDIRNLTILGYAQETVDEIRAYHSLEHIPYFEIGKVLKHWYNTLKKGGTILIAVPDLEECIKLLNNDYGWLQQNANIFGEVNPTGYWNKPQDWHRSGFTKKSIKQILEMTGFENITFLKPRADKGYDYEIILTAEKGSD